MTTANKITLLRIFLIPVFVMLAVYYGRSVTQQAPQEWIRIATIVVFVVAAVSDGVDGYLARHYGQRTQLGAILDPLADKGLMLAAIITLSVSNWKYELPLWFPVVVIARDVLVIAGAVVIFLLTGTMEIKPSRAGKIATALSMVALSLVMLQYNFLIGHLVLGSWKATVEFLDIPVAAAGLFTFLSGIGYAMDGVRAMHAAGHGEPKPPAGA